MQKTHGSLGDYAAIPSQLGVAHSGFSNPPTSSDWSRIQGIIFEYYVVQNHPLHVVRDYLRRDHGFRASDRMIKARLAKWEFTKNAKREDWGYLAVLYEQRKKESKPTIFDIRGHRKTVKDLQRFIRNQNISLEKFLVEALENVRKNGHQIPDYIRAYTPDRDDAIWSPAGDTSQSDIRSPSTNAAESIKGSSDEVGAGSNPTTDEFLHYRDPAESQRNSFEHDCPYMSYTNEQQNLSNVATAHSSMSTHNDSEERCKSCRLYSSERTRLELEACSSQLLKPIPLKSRIGHNDMRCWTIIGPRSPSPSSKDEMSIDERSTCSRCDQPCSVHFPSLDLFEPRQEQRNILNDTTEHTMNVPTSTRNEGSWVWVSYCFLACMSLKRGDEEVAQRVLDQAAVKFRTLLRAHDPLLLTAAGLMITVLHMHDQSKIVVRILQCAQSVVDEMLPENDPIRVTISYLALSANASSQPLRAARFSSAQLRPVYEELKRTHSAGHPYTIAAHHNYAWMLKHDGKLEEAEEHARQAYQESIACFGHMHMQTITSLSVIAGCLAPQKERDNECIEAYRTMINHATQILGIIHPYTLEAQRRLAHKLERIQGQVLTALKMHRTILFGRATMLGRSHEFTIGQREHYERMLRKLNLWEDQYGKPSDEHREVRDLFSGDPEEAWELVSRIDNLEITATLEVGDNLPDDTPENEWCRLAINESVTRSRSGSPSSGNEFEAY